ncbi:MAG: hypothetical protein Q9176_005810 [Flavoplaca citrina]
MIQENWLSNVIFTTVQSNVDLSRVRRGSGGDFQTGPLSQAVNSAETNEITVRAWLSKAADRKSTLVFCVDLAHLTALTAAFRTHNVDARFITGSTSKQVRGERLEAFRKQQFRVLLNCGVFTEGTDIPNIDCVLLARPTRSRNLLVQMIGRGMRIHPGKVNCHIIDMVASLTVGVVSTPTLFGLSPDEMVDEADADQLRSLQKRKELEALRERQDTQDGTANPRHTFAAKSQQTITFTDYDSVYDLIDDASADRHIRGISPLAWVLVDENRYILSGPNGEYLTIQMPPTHGGSKGLLEVWYTQKIAEEAHQPGKSPFMRPRLVAESETLSDAVHAADTLAIRRFAWRFVQHTQAWRKKPATEGQLMFLNKIRDTDNQLKADRISKGKAGDMITKLKFGAKGWFGRLEAAKKKESKLQDRLQDVATLRKCEQVKVGPLDKS